MHTPMPLLVVLALLIQRVIAALPNAAWVWKSNDTARAFAFLALAVWVVTLVPWSLLGPNCITTLRRFWADEGK